MNHISLTARYRPQTFADLAGQSTLKAILSRAAAEDKIAPAYLFSGTRGVGKTTVARVFAKALNCRSPVKTAYGIEPCNACAQCKSITQGSSMNVMEIDGASNRGIDDVRALKESVGYAPMEGRYKIFIIDEAHMLSRDAFNALLKTLEEPPAQVTFMLATTEPHKFPATIISRCQHYVFKQLGDVELFAHLQKILGLEQVDYEDAALRLLVRRAAGSVRDAMTMLAQVLTLSGTSLKETDTRAVLGLAGQELFFGLLAAIQQGDCAGLSKLTRQLLDQGIDLGFFLREMTLMWRNLFMLNQIGEAAESLIELPKAEAQKWRGEAQNMNLAHIHACWQLTIEGQRRVLTSLEPSLALELLLFNLAMLPKLMNLEQLSTLERRQTAEKKSPEQSLNPPESDAKNSAKSVVTTAQQPVSAEQSIPPAEKLVEKPAEMPAEPETDVDYANKWQNFLSFCAAQTEAGGLQLHSGLSALLYSVKAQWDALELRITPPNKFSATRLAHQDINENLRSLLKAFCGKTPELRFLPPPEVLNEREDIKETVERLPIMQALKEQLGASLIDYGPWHK